MAHHTAAKKSIRQTEKRTARNRHIRSTYRTSVKKLDAAITAKDKDNVVSLFRAAQTQLMKAVTKNVIKQATASRKVSRLNAAVKKLLAA